MCAVIIGQFSGPFSTAQPDKIFVGKMFCGLSPSFGNFYSK